MRIPRLFLPLSLGAGREIDLDEERSHYLASVLRLRPGAQLLVFNGEGGQYPAEVVAFARKRARIRLGALNPHSSESPLRIHLGLGISRGERMDLVIQKAVELGVDAITPLETERSVVKFDSERRRSRWEHWQKVARSASEQCGRTRVLEIAEPSPFEDWLAGSGLKLLLDPQGRLALNELAPPGDSVRLLSGPEGGFTAQERERAVEAGFLAIRLGPRILRTETAAIAALTAVQLLWGDLGRPAPAR